MPTAVDGWIDDPKAYDYLRNIAYDQAFQDWAQRQEPKIWTKIDLHWAHKVWDAALDFLLKERSVMITTHHDGHGLNESIEIKANKPGPGGASHYYEFWIREGENTARVGTLQFQEGPRNVEGSTPGLTSAAVVAALVDHLSGFQKGEYANRETALAITKLEEALHWIRHRADERASRNVLGTYAK